MAAPFSTSYDDTLKRDLRHIYSGHPPCDIKLRTTKYHTGIDVVQRYHWLQTRRSVPQSPRKLVEYIPEYQTYLPKAHGYQTLSKGDIDFAVHRLSRPRQYGCSGTVVTDTGNQTDRSDRSKGSQSAPVGGRGATPREKKSKQLSEEYVKAMCDRLHSTETHMSKLRQRQPYLNRPQSSVDRKDIGSEDNK